MAVIGTAGGTKVIRVTGFVPTRYRIVDVETGASVAIGPITTGITATGTLRYKATAPMPAAVGAYEIQWDDGSGAWAATEDLTVQIANSDSSDVTIEGPWPVGASVSIYERRGSPGQGSSPPGLPLLATETVATNVTVTVSGLGVGKYWAIGQDSANVWRWVAFAVDA